MNTVDIHQKFIFHGDPAADLIQVHHSEDCVWVDINSFVTKGAVAGPEITVHFARGLAGRRQVLNLVSQLERAAFHLLKQFEDTSEKVDA
jgi:hypothetical protein